MMVSYAVQNLTLDRISVEIVDAAMEELNFPFEFPTSAVKSVVYQVLSHDAVWDEELEEYARNARTVGSVDGECPSDDNLLSEISYVAHTVLVKLLEEYSAKYADEHITLEAVAAALAAAEVECESSVMRTLLADYFTGGVPFVEENDHTALQVFNVKAADIIRVASLL